MRAAREAGVHRDADEASERVTSLTVGEEVFVVEAQGEWTRVLAPGPADPPRPGRLPGLGPQRRARRGRPARGGARLPRHAVRLGRARAATASTARGWCTSRFRADRVAGAARRGRPGGRGRAGRGPAAGRPLLLRAPRRGGQPRRVRDRGRPAAREPRRRRGRGADARGAAGHAARRRSAAQMTLASGVGSHPGDDQRDFDEAVRLVLGELPDLPYLPELPGRGAPASMTGRALAVVADLGADLQPAGWRLTGSGARRASTTGGRGACSPRTSTGWRNRRRTTTGRSRSRSPDRGPSRRPSSGRAATRCSPTTAPGASSRRHWPRGSPSTSPTYAAGCRARHRLVVQVDEPALAAVLAAGADRVGLRAAPHGAPARGVGGARVGPRRDRRGGRRAVGALVRPGHAARPAARRRRAGLSVDLDQVDGRGHDALAEALDAGQTVVLGVLPATDGAGRRRRGHRAWCRWLEARRPGPGRRRAGAVPGVWLAGSSPVWAAASARRVARPAPPRCGSPWRGSHSPRLRAIRRWRSPRA